MRSRRQREGETMTELPEVKLKMPDGRTEICDFEGVKNYLYNWDLMLVIDGQVINSYGELVKLIERSPYKDRDIIEAVAVEVIVGG